MPAFERDVRKVLLAHGCHFVRHGKGSHDIWFSPIAGRNLTVPTRIKSRHTANAIMKQAGIDHQF
jgi:predicted RNA binding protein YcfA (HicA-like mRNA interferase family)